MNIHEYQAKQLLKEYGLPVSDGRVVLKADEAKKEISEDDRKRSETEVQKLTDEIIKSLDETASAKEKEILGK